MFDKPKNPCDYINIQSMFSQLMQQRPTVSHMTVLSKLYMLVTSTWHVRVLVDDTDV